MAIKIRTAKREIEVTVKRGSESSVFRGIPLDPTELEALREEYTTLERESGQVVPKTDWIGMRVAKIHKVIRGWDLVDEQGEPVPCDSDNRYTAYLLNPSIIHDALEKFDRIGSGQEAPRDDSEAIQGN